MKARILTLAILAIVIALPAQAKKDKKDKGAEPVAMQLVTRDDSASCAFGMAMGQQINKTITQFAKDIDYTLNPEIIVKSIKATIENDTVIACLTDEEISQIHQTISQLGQAAQEKQKLEVVENNKQREIAFLDSVAKLPGVTKTESGLLYAVDQLGNGELPTLESVITVEYVGRLITGEEFDSSYKRGKPLEMQLNALIPGWKEGISLMPVGSKYTLFIPAMLAYGEEGQGPIPPYCTLIFEVVLVDAK